MVLPRGDTLSPLIYTKCVEWPALIVAVQILPGCKIVCENILQTLKQLVQQLLCPGWTSTLRDVRRCMHAVLNGDSKVSLSCRNYEGGLQSPECIYQHQCSTSGGFTLYMNHDHPYLTKHAYYSKSEQVWHPAPVSSSQPIPAYICVIEPQMRVTKMPAAVRHDSATVKTGHGNCPMLIQHGPASLDNC